MDTDKARADLKAAEKQFAATGDAASKLELELANAKYENARRNLTLVSDNAKSAEKNIKSLTGVAAKADNRIGTGIGGIITSLGAAGAWQALAIERNNGKIQKIL